MKKTNGFTLIELSISLVIIGIIVAAIASGSVIIKQATIRSVVSDVRAISTAINSFKVQYGTLPGDLSNAQTYWPVVASTPTANLANGNGNGYIDGTENNNVFQMLSLAGLIQYTIANSAYYPSKYSNSANYQISNVGSVYGSAGLGDVLNLANYSSSSYYGAVKPQDAYDIDNKMDDGLLYSGIVYTAKGIDKGSTAGLCTTSTTIYTSSLATASADSYNMSDSTSSCWLLFWIVD